MKVFFAGPTGVIGRRAVPCLVEAGHDLTAVSRSDEGAAWLEQAAGAAVDGNDVIFHFATAIPPWAKMTDRRSWATNDRLRSEATSNLVDAALRHDVAGFVQESITFF
jgi:nucleoside-diphosphate-sugar epimerase